MRHVLAGDAVVGTNVRCLARNVGANQDRLTTDLQNVNPENDTSWILLKHCRVLEVLEDRPHFPPTVSFGFCASVGSLRVVTPN